MTLTKLSTIPKGEAVSVLNYGNAKTGKTFFAGTAGDRSLFISNGDGHSTLQSKFFKDKIGTDPFIEIVGTDDIVKGATAFRKIAELIEQNVKNTEIDTIIVDDASRHVQASMLMAMEINQALGTSKTLLKTSKFDLLLPEVQDYKTEIENTLQFYSWVISECKHYKKHFILLAHQRNTFKKGKNIGDTKELIKTVPFFTGADSAPDRIPGLFDWVLHSEATGAGERARYKVRTEGDESLMAGCRDAKGIFPTIIEDPNFLKMVQSVREGKWIV